MCMNQRVLKPKAPKNSVPFKKVLIWSQASGKELAVAIEILFSPKQDFAHADPCVFFRAEPFSPDVSKKAWIIVSTHVDDLFVLFKQTRRKISR